MSREPFSDLFSLLSVDRNAPLSLEAQLSDQLTNLIASGRIRSSDRLPPMSDLARQLGINRLTVRASYARLAERGLVEMQRGSGTRVLPHGLSNLRTGESGYRSFTIGVILPAFADFYRPLFEGIRSVSSGDPSQLLICDSQEDPAAAERYLRQLTARNVDGIIVVSQDLPNDLQPPSESGAPPIVYADVPDAPHPSILFDGAGVDAAIEHLFEHGHRRIALVSPGAEYSNMGIIIDQHRVAMEQRGAPWDEDLHVVVPDFTVQSGRRAFTGISVTAALAASDPLAFGIMQASRERAVAIPDDLALISYGDSELSRLIEPPLTSVTLPAFEMGRQAMTTLQSLLAGQTPGDSPPPLPTTLTIRSSCGRHATGR